MNIESMFWEAKDENEARVIWGLLYGFIAHSADHSYEAWEDDRFFYTENGVLAGGIRADSAKLNKSTIPDLVQMALRGFKEVWEVAPEGYRLVTDEELKNCDYKLINEYMYIYNHESAWIKATGCPCHWECDRITYAVPVDFEFAPKKVKIVCEGKEVFISRESAQALNLVD